MIDYPLHTFRIFPYIALTFSMRNLTALLTSYWTRQAKKIFQPGNAKLAELHALISVNKVLSSTTAMQGIMECRKACGGLGYSYYSRFADLMTGCDV